MPSLLVVGGGPSGVSLLYQLTGKLEEARARASLDVILVDRGAVGPGLAFATSDPLHILNVPVSDMTIDPSRPTQFLEWWRQEAARGGLPARNASATRHPARYVFGAYLQGILRSIDESVARRQIHLEQRRDELVGLQRRGRRFLASFSSGSTETFDAVVLALGHQAPDSYREFEGRNDYVGCWKRPTDWHFREPMVVVLGTRLSAIDAALTLIGGGYKGRICMVSRSGWLPRVAAPSLDYELRYVTDGFIESTMRGTLGLEALTALVRAELETAAACPLDWDRLLHPEPSTLETFRRDVMAARSRRARPWESVVMALYARAPDIWRLLTEEAKIRFHQELDSLWMTHLGTVPLLNGERVLAMLESGQLTVHGGLSGVSYDEAASIFVIQLATADRPIHSRVLINGTGPGYDLANCSSPVIVNLLESGLAVAHPCGGFRLNTQTLEVLDAGGRDVEGLFVLGDMTHGEWFATADMTHNAMQAAIVVDELLSRWHLAAAPSAGGHHVSDRRR
jgi:uncharacterized NAD(P)/FAD-binding protein YdhS